MIETALVSDNSSINFGLSTDQKMQAQFPLCISIEIDCLKNEHCYIATL